MVAKTDPYTNPYGLMNEKLYWGMMLIQLMQIIHSTDYIWVITEDRWVKCKPVKEWNVQR
jgi:hypothetical protein